MSHSGAHSSHREELHTNVAPPSQYREVKQIRISDGKQASKLQVLLTHVSGVVEEFTATEKIKEAIKPVQEWCLKEGGALVYSVAFNGTKGVFIEE